MFGLKPPVIGLIMTAPLWSTNQDGREEWEVRARILAITGNFLARPGSADVDPSRPFVICVLGEPDLIGYLEASMKGRKVRGRQPEIRYLRRWSLELVKDCDILYISESELDRLPDILQSLKGTRILTVAGSAFAKGVMINLPVRDRFIQVEVNLKRLKEAGLEIGAAFLSKAQAKVVDG